MGDSPEESKNIKALRFDIITAKFLLDDDRTPRLHDELQAAVNDYENSMKGGSLAHDCDEIRAILDRAFEHWMALHEHPTKWAKLLHEACSLRSVLAKQLIVEYLDEKREEHQLSGMEERVMQKFRDGGGRDFSAPLDELGLGADQVERFLLRPRRLRVKDLTDRQEYAALDEIIHADQALAKLVFTGRLAGRVFPLGVVDGPKVLTSIEVLSNRFAAEFRRARDSAVDPPVSAQSRHLSRFTSFLGDRLVGLRLRSRFRASENGNRQSARRFEEGVV